MGKLAVIDVDRADLKSHGFGILDGQMTEPAHAGDRDPFAGLGFGLLDPLISRNAGTDERGGFLSRKTGWNMSDVVRIGQNTFGEPPIPGVATELGIGADCLPSGQAVFAMPARRIEPRHSDPVALLHDSDARSHR